MSEVKDTIKAWRVREEREEMIVFKERGREEWER